MWVAQISFRWFKKVLTADDQWPFHPHSGAFVGGPHRENGVAYLCDTADIMILQVL